MRPTGARRLERDVEERLTAMRLRLIEEKLNTEKRAIPQGAGAVGGSRRIGGRTSAAGASAAVDDDDDDAVENTELQQARKRQAELRDLLHRERQLAERLANRITRRRPTPSDRRAGEVEEVEHPRERRQGDRFADMMEMMMMQNSQMHNLMLNQMMARQALQLQPQQQPPPPPPPPPPQFPMYLHMPGYEGLFQQPKPAETLHVKPEAEISKPATPAQPVERRMPKDTARSTGDDENDQKTFPFPGNRSQQKLRRLAYTAFFIASLNRLTTENKFRPRFDFLFDVRLKEMLETLHRIYKTPDGHLYSVTFATVMGEEALELTELMNLPKTLSKDEERVVTQEIAYCIENTIFQVTDIMPSKGILGTHRKSGVFEMIRSGNRFPAGYFYEMEKDMMEFDQDGRTLNVSDCDARMLLIGLFLVRALIETLYLKTEHYGMVVETTAKAERNIKLVATLLMYIYRKVVGQLTVMNQGTKKARISIPDLPAVLSKVMHTDQEIRPVLKLAKKSMDYAINLLMHWSEEYVKRLRDAAFT